VTVWFLSIKEFFRRVKPKILFYLGLGAWVNGGAGEESPQICADGRRSGRKKRMSEDLDNPRVLKRLAWSILAALLAAAPLNVYFSESYVIRPRYINTPMADNTVNTQPTTLKKPTPNFCSG
jgi:hypothetical protein